MCVEEEGWSVSITSRVTRQAPVPLFRYCLNVAPGESVNSVTSTSRPDKITGLVWQPFIQFITQDIAVLAS
jgi:hypothetical protein